MATRYKNLPLGKLDVDGSTLLADTGNTVQIKTEAGALVATATESPAGSYTANWTEFDGWGYWWINGVRLDSKGRFWLGKDAGSQNLDNSFEVTAPITFATDNTYDIGSSGANRARDLFIARNSAIGGAETVGSTLTVGADVTAGNVVSDTMTTTGAFNSYYATGLSSTGSQYGVNLFSFSQLASGVKLGLRANLQRLTQSTNWWNTKLRLASFADSYTLDGQYANQQWIDFNHETGSVQIGVGLNPWTVQVANNALAVDGTITGGTYYENGLGATLDLANNSGERYVKLGWGASGFGSVWFQNDNLLGANDTTIQFQPGATTDYGVVETWNGAGLVVGTGNIANAPIIFRINRTEKARLNASLLAVTGSISPTIGTNSSNYSTGWLGGGYTLDNNSSVSGKSYLEVDNMRVRGTLDVYTLQVNTIRATNGSLWVTDSAIVESIPVANDVIFTSPSGSIAAPFAVNDLIQAQMWGNDSSHTLIRSVAARVTAAPPVSGNAFRITVTYLSGGPFRAGDSVVRVGNTIDTNRQNSIFLTASDSNNPYMSVLSGVNDFANVTGSTKVRLGNLTGVTSAQFGALSDFGMWASGSVYLEGSINATAGEIANWGISQNSMGAVSGTKTLQLFAIDDAGSGTHYPSIRAYDSSSKVMATMGKIYYGNAWQNQFGFCLTTDYTSGNPVFQVSSGSTGITAQIAGWSFDTTKLSKTNAILSSTGYISFGGTPPTSYGNNAGAWLGDVSGTAKLSLYNSASNFLQWDGSSLTAVGGRIGTAPGGFPRVEMNGPSGSINFVSGSGGPDLRGVSITPSYFNSMSGYDTVVMKGIVGTNFPAFSVGDPTIGSDRKYSFITQGTIETTGATNANGGYNNCIMGIGAGGVTYAGDAVSNGDSLGGAALMTSAHGFLNSSTADGYAGALRLARPLGSGYKSYDSVGATTLTRHNYIIVEDLAWAGSNVTMNNACVLMFDAAAGTHKAVDGSSTKTTPGAVSAWVKININGTIYYVPAYTSKTS